MWAAEIPRGAHHLALRHGLVFLVRPPLPRTLCTLQMPYKKTSSNPFKLWVLKRTIGWVNGYPGYLLRFSRSTQSAGVRVRPPPWLSLHALMYF